MTAPRDHRVVVYVDNAGEYRWRRLAGNGRRVGASGEGFADWRGAIRAAEIAHGWPIGARWHRIYNHPTDSYVGRYPTPPRRRATTTKETA